MDDKRERRGRGGKRTRAPRGRCPVERLEDRVLLSATRVPAPHGTQSSSPRQVVDVGGTAFFTTSAPAQQLWASDGTAGGTLLLAGFGTNSASAPLAMTAAGGLLYFSAAAGSGGRELWRSDGTPGGTLLLKDINPGAGSSSPAGFVVAGDSVYFTADDGAHGAELWKTDGTAAGTVLVRDVRPGTASPAITDLTALNGAVVFSADDGVAGRELWRSDGTTTGTTMLADIRPGTQGSLAGGFVVLDDRLYFAATTAPAGRELWASDGTAAGTAQVIDLNTALPAGSSPTGLAVVDGHVYFAATHPTLGPALFRTDGTVAGTVAVKAVKVDGAIMDAEGRPFFTGDGGDGEQLWTSDGTPGGTIALFNAPLSLMTAGGRAYFTANDPATGTELWSTDGSPAGTALVRDILPGAESSNVTALARVGPTVFFSANDGAAGEELWRVNAADNVAAMVKDVNAAPKDDYPTRLVAFKGKLYFGTGSFTGATYALDPATGAVTRIAPVPADKFAVVGNTMYFGVFGGGELWKTDGTAAGTSAVGYYGGVQNIVAFNGRAYFSAWYNTPGYKLWSTDGTFAGTRPVIDNAAKSYGPSEPRGYRVIGSKMYFAALVGTGISLYATDGTAAGTLAMGGPSMGSQYDVPDIEEAGGQALFAGTDGKVWRSDGTVNGAKSSPATIQLDPRTPSRSIATVNGTAFYFGAGGLWSTSGGGGGTLLKAIVDDGYPMFGMTRVGNKVFFVDQRGGNEEFDLWASDGTAAGTTIVKRFFADRAANGPLPVGDITDVGGVAYFAAQDRADGSGYELWRSDGTAAGTQLAADLNPGPASSYADQVTDVNGTPYLIADDGASWSGFFKVNPPAVAPAPVGFTAAAASAVRVDLAWGENGDDHGGFLLERSLTADFAVIDDSFTLPASARTFSDPVAVPGTHCYYRLRASSPLGYSAPVTADVTTPPRAFAPGLTQIDPATGYSGIVGLRGQVYLSGGAFVRNDGTATTGVVAAGPMAPSAVNGRLVYATGGSLWGTDGTAQNAVRLVDLTASAKGVAVFQDRFYFLMNGSLWVSDGTPAGTHATTAAAADKRLQVVQKVLNDPNAVENTYVTLGDSIYYIGDGSNGAQVFRTDATTTTQLTSRPTVAGVGYSYPHGVTVAGNFVYFIAEPVTQDSTAALWRTDGTVQGTVQVKKLPNGRFGNAPGEMAGAGGLVYFADAGTFWVSDGTEAGTVQLATFPSFNGTPAISGMTVVGGRPYFATQQPTGSGQYGALYTAKLWTSDGTVAGTVPVPGLPATTNVYTIPSVLTAYDGSLYFTAPGTVPFSTPVYRYTPPAVGLPAPAAPTGLTAAAFSSGQVNLAWADNGTNEDGYVVERSASATFATVDRSVTLPPNATHYADAGLAPLTTYYYRVRAFNSGGPSADAVAPAATTTGGPLAPDGLTLTDASPGEQVDVRWVDRSTNETGFVVQRSTSADFLPASSIAFSVTLPAGTTSYRDATVERLTRYYYRVFAVNAQGSSPAAVASTTTPDSRPTAPSALVTAGVSAAQIDLVWQDNAVNESALDGYKVERAGADGAFATVATLPANATAFSDSGLTPGGQYTYRVTASNAIGTSDPATSAPTQTLPPTLATTVTQLAPVAVATQGVNVDPTPVVTLGGDGYFLASDWANGPLHTGLWRTDGTTANTTLVRDFGDVGGDSLFRVGDALFFTLTTNVNGPTYLWKTDGTAAGTVQLKQLYAVVQGQTRAVGERLDAGGRYYFAVNSTAGNGTLWTSDGTVDGTVPLKTFASARVDGIAAYGGHVYFNASGKFVTDGTVGGTVPSADPVPGFGSSTRVAIGGKLFYILEFSLYVNDGTGAPNVQLAAGVLNFTVVGDRMVYSTTTLANNAYSSDVWVTDGSSPAAAVKLAHLGYGTNAGVRGIARLGDGVVFSIDGNYTELWRSDLTPAGTVQYAHLIGSADRMATLGGRVTFRGGSPNQLWATDGTAAGTGPVTALGGIPRVAHPDQYVTVGDTVYYVSSILLSATAADKSGQELWATDGTLGHTRRLFVGPADNLTAYAGRLYFVSGGQLWGSDGTAAGTAMVADVRAASGLPSLAIAGGTGDTMFVRSFDTSGQQLWTVDLPTGHVVKLANLRIKATKFAVSGGSLYYLDGSGFSIGDNGLLWRTDGSTAPVQVNGPSHVNSIFDVGGTLFVFASTTLSAGTFGLFTVSPGGDATFVKQLGGATVPTPVGGQLYFGAPDPLHPNDGDSLWRSDGTAAGTVPIFDPIANVQANNSGRAWAIADAGGGVAYFIASDQFDVYPGATGALWRTDGTPAGTTRVRGVSVPQNVTPYYARPLFLTVVDGKAVYCDGDFLWRSDGTLAGTVQIDRVGTAADGTRSPAWFGGAPFAVLGWQILFGGAVPGGGMELRVASLRVPDAPDALQITQPAPAAPAAAPGAAVAAAPAPAPGVTLTWADHSATETGFAIDRSTRADFAAIDRTFYVGRDVTSFTDATAPAGARYFYRVRAVNAGGLSAASNGITAGAPGVFTAAFNYAAAVQSLVVRFTADVSPTLAAADLGLIDLSTGRAVATGALGLSYDRATNALTVTFPDLPGHALPDGRYRLTVRAAGVATATGLKLDGNGDGAGGDDYKFDFFHMNGDANRDGGVNFNDLVPLAQHYNNRSGTMTWADGDFTGDGNVDFDDLVKLAQNYNTSLTGAAAAAPATGAPAPFDAAMAAAFASVAAPQATTPKPRAVSPPVVKPKPPVVVPLPTIKAKPPAAAKPAAPAKLPAPSLKPIKAPPKPATTAAPQAAPKAIRVAPNPPAAKVTSPAPAFGTTRIKG